MKIKIVNKDNKKEVDLFEKKEWKLFDKGTGHRHKEKKYSFAVYDGNKIIGYSKFKIVGGAAHLSQLLISKKYRRKGIGELLMKNFEDFSKKKKCHIAYLDASERHKEAINFYKKMGYKRVAKLKNNEFHITWYVLEKELKRKKKKLNEILKFK